MSTGVGESMGRPGHLPSTVKTASQQHQVICTAALWHLQGSVRHLLKSGAPYAQQLIGSCEQHRCTSSAASDHLLFIFRAHLTMHGELRLIVYDMAATSLIVHNGARDMRKSFIPQGSVCSSLHILASIRTIVRMLGRVIAQASRFARKLAFSPRCGISLIHE
jgi:hypothetical protein